MLRKLSARKISFFQESGGLSRHLCRGKSGLQRARCWITSRGSDSRQVQQKADRRALRGHGKGERVVQETTGCLGDKAGQVYPIWSKTK